MDKLRPLIAAAVMFSMLALTAAPAAAQPTDQCPDQSAGPVTVETDCGVERDGTFVNGFAAGGADADVVGAGAGTNNTVGVISDGLFNAAYVEGNDTEAGGQALGTGFGAGAGYAVFGSPFFGGFGVGAGAGVGGTGAGAGAGCGYGLGSVPDCSAGT